MAYNQLLSSEEDVATGGHKIDPKQPQLLVSASEAIRSGYSKANCVLSMCVNFGLNYGLTFWTMNGNDAVGLWSKPASPSPASSAMGTDLALTCFFVVFFTALINSYVIRGEIRKAKVIPIESMSVHGGIYRFFPMRVENIWARSLLFALEFFLLYLVPSFMALAVACESGWMKGPDGDPVCQMKANPNYFLFKGFWAAVLAGFAYPLVFLAGAKREFLPPEVYEKFVEQQMKQVPFSAEQDIASQAEPAAQI